MLKIDNGFLKVDIAGFHPYLAKISDVVDIFYKKDSESPINFSIQNHKLTISKPTNFVNKIEVDHKSIFVNYNNWENLENQIKYFKEIVDGIFKCVGFKPEEVLRIGHAIHYIKKEDIENITNKIFSTSHKVLNFNDVAIEIKLDETRAVKKILSTPLDVSQNKQVLLINADYYSTKTIKTDKILDFLTESGKYFNTEESIISGIYE